MFQTRAVWKKEAHILCGYIFSCVSWWTSKCKGVGPQEMLLLCMHFHTFIFINHRWSSKHTDYGSFLFLIGINENFVSCEFMDLHVPKYICARIKLSSVCVLCFIIIP